MRLLDAVGFLASGLVVAAFCMEDVVSLRLVALMSNVGFFIYGIGLGLAPVWLLHAILLLVNVWRLWQATACAIAQSESGDRPGLNSRRCIE
jgi:hypothetical protein